MTTRALFADVAHCRPLSQLVARFEAQRQRLGAVAFRDVLIAWIGSGYSPKNQLGMLDWMRDGIPEKRAGLARTNGSRASPDVSPQMEGAALAKAQWEERKARMRAESEGKASAG